MRPAIPATIGKSAPQAILAGTFLAFLGPFLLVQLFPAQLDMVVDKSSYLVFHNVSEFFSIMVSLSVFSIGWFTYDQSKDRHALFLSAAFLAVGLIDFMHTMSNAAMPAFLTPNSTNKSTQFWIAARILDSSAFLVSAFIYSGTRSRWLSRKFLLCSALVTTLSVFISVVYFPSYLPATAIQGVGLTPLKRYLEFLVIILLALAVAAYWKRLQLTKERSLVYYPAAFIICMFSEGVFASYKTGFDAYNVLGHIYKVIAFYLIYRGVFIAAVKAPYEKLADEWQIRHLASFPQLNPNPVLELDRTGAIVFSNPASRTLLDECAGNHQALNAFLPPDMDDFLLELAAKKETSHYREITVGERSFGLTVQLVPQYDMARIYAYDITVRKRAEEELRKSETKYRTLFENMIDGFALHQVVADETGKPVDYIFLEANSAFEKLTGLKVEDILNKRVTQVMPDVENEPADWIGVFGKVAQTGSELRFEQYSELLGRWYSITAYSPMRNYFATVFEDVTDHKLASETLRQAHDQLELRVAERTEELVETVDSLIAEMTTRTQAENSLQRLNRLYDVLNEINKTIVRVKDRNALFDDFCRIAVEHGGFMLSWIGMVDNTDGAIQMVAAHGDTGYLDNISITCNDEPVGLGPTGTSMRDGTYYICNDFQNASCTKPWHERGKAHGIFASASIAIKEEGGVVGALTLYAGEKDFFDNRQVELLRQMGSDISFAIDNLQREARRKDAERSLQEEILGRLQAVEALREQEHILIQQNRLAAMGEMIGNIAHQWRQPLNTLGLFTQRLGFFYGSPSFNKEFLDTSVAKSMEIIQYMSRTIDDFRNFFATEREKSEFRVEEALNRALSLVEASFRERSIILERVGEAAATIEGFPNEYSQVLLNILINAKDVFNERNIEFPCMRICIGIENGASVVTIADNAGGIPEEIMDKIFDPYFTTKGPQQGTGIGLFMSKAIIENNMGGRLSVRNTNVGAEFRIEVECESA